MSIGGNRMMALQRNLQLVKQFTQQVRLSSSSTTNGNISPILTNRNPRNLEKMRIGYKPDGYHVEKKGRSFWHKLTLNISPRYITASINHFQNGPVITASTNEWAIQKQLYSCTDHSAYVNLARVLADRCLQCGITEFRCDIESTNPEGKISAFLKTLEESGLTLSEPPQFKAAKPWDQTRPEKPWEVTK